MAGVLLLIALDRKFKLRRGAMFWSYLIWYGIGRIIMETMRIDAADTIYILGIGLRVHMWLAIAMVVLGATGLVFVFRKLRPQPDPGVYLPGREPKAEVTESAKPADAAKPTDAAKPADHENGSARDTGEAGPETGNK